MKTTLRKFLNVASKLTNLAIAAFVVACLVINARAYQIDPTSGNRWKLIGTIASIILFGILYVVIEYPKVKGWAKWLRAHLRSRDSGRSA